MVSQCKLYMTLFLNFSLNDTKLLNLKLIYIKHFLFQNFLLRLVKLHIEEETTYMENSKWPFVSHFSQLRENPKWLIKLILLIVVTIGVTFLSTHLTDQTEALKNQGFSQSQIEQQKQFAWIAPVFGSIGSLVHAIGVNFLIFLVISKIMRSTTRPLSIFSASLSYSLIINALMLIVYLIMAIAGLKLNDYNIVSLNIFDKGNPYLGNINLFNLVSAYLIGVVYYATSRLSRRASIIWAIVALIFFIGTGLFGAWSTNVT